jgi:hypothetical protein
MECDKWHMVGTEWYGTQPTAVLPLLKLVKESNSNHYIISEHQEAKIPVYNN